MYELIKDPADLVEKPLHALGLHSGSAVAFCVAFAVLVAALTVWRRRRTSIL